MFRKLTAALAALFVVAGFGLAAAAPAQATVIPSQGHYTGMDHSNHSITFSFSGNALKSFKVNGYLIGDSRTHHSAHISNGMWHETCHNGYCFKGHWQDSHTVVGYWRHGGSHHWTAFDATMPRAIRPFHGGYQGMDHHQNAITFGFGGSLHGFKVNGHGSFPSVHPSSHGVFHETCSSSHWCIKGHWQDDYTVVGYWKSGTHGTWYAWEAQYKPSH